MLASGLPVKFPVPFANGAGASYIRNIPVASQIGIQNGAASFTDGFPPNTFSAIASGGQPPFGQDINGILNEITAWDRWVQAGGPIAWDSAFASSIGGYPKGAIVGSNILAGGFWMSTVDNNMSNPDAFGAGWVWDPSTWSTGMMQPSLFSAVPAGWVQAKSSYTIGNATSGATYASPDAVFIFVALWNGLPNTQCPVSTGRGASGLADFNAGKTIQSYDASGCSVIGVDNGTGRLSGVPVQIGSINTPGSIIGENLHQLTPAEIAYHYHNGSGTTGGMNSSNPHAHPVTIPGNTGNTGGGGAFGNTPISSNTGNTDINHGHGYSFSTDSGNTGNGYHNTVARSAAANWLLKL